MTEITQIFPFVRIFLLHASTLKRTNTPKTIILGLATMPMSKFPSRTIKARKMAQETYRKCHHHLLKSLLG
jgi:hypothetical protein